MAEALGDEWERWSKGCHPGTEKWEMLKKVATTVELSNRKGVKLVTLVDATADVEAATSQTARRLGSAAPKPTAEFDEQLLNALLQGPEIARRGKLLLAVSWSNARVVEAMLNERGYADGRRPCSEGGAQGAAAHGYALLRR